MMSRPPSFTDKNIDSTTPLILDRIQPGDIHLWYVYSNRVADPKLLSAYRELMNPEEKAQHVRFVFEKGRHEYLMTRALVRTCLSYYAEVDPSAWTFSKNDHGRPVIDTPRLSSPLDF